MLVCSPALADANTNAAASVVGWVTGGCLFVLLPLLMLMLILILILMLLLILILMLLLMLLFLDRGPCQANRRGSKLDCSSALADANAMATLILMLLPMPI